MRSLINTTYEDMTIYSPKGFLYEILYSGYMRGEDLHDEAKVLHESAKLYFKDSNCTGYAMRSKEYPHLDEAWTWPYNSVFYHRSSDSLYKTVDHDEDGWSDLIDDSEVFLSYYQYGTCNNDPGPPTYKGIRLETTTREEVGIPGVNQFPVSFDFE